MKKIFYYLSILLIYSSCNESKSNYLIKIIVGEFDEHGTPSGYINKEGDTIIPIGKYFYCYTDTIRDFGMVIKKGGPIIGIDKNDNELFEVYNFDNGPDYIKGGLFRIIKNDLIGYANINGEIIIEPAYKCAFPFENGKAKVSNICTKKRIGEHSYWESNKWFYINKKGKRFE
ncbi:hypothetical protein MNBD_BACTEROID02-1290 [hydrothermal vent metagenome]|uniref:WG repeat-containing protein n=1 Tax=hydrothermal vent metagenome TaxID=652676 RepID=A0A3B0RR23_9ZZZZ